MTYNGRMVEDHLLIGDVEGKRQQVGYDLTVKDIVKLTGGMGVMDADSKMHTDNVFARGGLWSEAGECVLEPGGVYIVTFDQGLAPLGDKEWAEIIQRSSFNRIGTRIQGSVYDPGYKTQNLEATIYVGPVAVALLRHCRVAQILIHECHQVHPDETYGKMDNTHQG